MSEGREGVKWELGFAWEMGFCALGLGFMKKKTIENGNGISICATQAGIVGLELGFEKKQFPGKWDEDPPSRPSIQTLKESILI